jgi:hypothetical protein
MNCMMKKDYETRFQVKFLRHLIIKLKLMLNLSFQCVISQSRIAWTENSRYPLRKSSSLGSENYLPLTQTDKQTSIFLKKKSPFL